MTKKKDSIFIKMLKENENTNIDEDFINFKIGGELDYDIKDLTVSTFLDIKLSTIRKRLNNSFSQTKRFIENVDYIRVKTGISNNINYMLNYACFEKLAMSGDSEKSESVRMYFTKLREFITDNQHIIYQALNNYNDLKIYNNMNTIYFFAADERYKNILKVGKSIKILEQIRNYSPLGVYGYTYNVGRIKEIELKYLALVKNPLLIEKCIKLLLKKNQVFSLSFFKKDNLNGFLKKSKIF
jgi:hypothetical protein